MYRQQNAGQNQNLMTANKTSEHGAKFKYLSVTVTNQDYIHEEARSIAISGNTCYHSVHNHPSSHLLSKNAKKKT
jgi:hypothetical protein